MAGSPRQPIPVLFLVGNAFRLAWQQRDDALRLGLIPTLVCFAGFLYARDAMNAMIESKVAAITGDGSTAATAVAQVPADVDLTLSLAGLVVFVALSIVATNWLRFALIGPMSAPGLGLRIGRPHVSFTLILLAMLMVATIAAGKIGEALALIGGLVGLIGFVAMLIAIVVIAARLMPLAVALAISQPISVKDAWAASRGNGIVLAFALFVTEVVFLIGLFLLSQVLAVIGFAQAAPIALLFIAAIANVAIAIVHSNILAAAFRHMVGIKV